MRIKVEDWLGSTEVEWLDGEDLWTVVVDWGEIDGQVEAVGMHLRQPVPARRPVTAAALRRLKVGELVSRARRQKYVEAGGDLVEVYRAAQAGEEDRHLLDELSPGTVDAIEREVAPFGVRGRGRPREYDQAHFAKVAKIYSAALEAGLPPLQAVMTTQHVSKPTASRWVARARDLGMLQPTTPGKPSRAVVVDDVQAGD